MDGEARLRPWPHDRQEIVKSLHVLGRSRGLYRVVEIAQQSEPLDGRLCEITPKLFEPGRAQDPIGENRHVEIDRAGRG